MNSLALNFGATIDRSVGLHIARQYEAVGGVVEDSSIILGERWRSVHRELDQAIEASLELSEDGVAVDSSTYLYASQFLDWLPVDVSIPEISVDADGEIEFDWYEGPRQVFTVYVGRDGRLTYAGLFGHRRYHGVEFLGEDVPETVKAYIYRVATTDRR